MADEISSEVKLLHGQFLTASKETTGEITKLQQQFDAVFQKIGASSEAGIAAVVAQLEKLDAKFAKTVQDAKAKRDSLKFDKLAEGFQAIGDKAGVAFSGAIDGGQKYEAAINRVRAISGLGAKDIEQLNKDIEELGVKFGFAVGPTQTAEIALQALGSGFETVAESTTIAKSSLALIADGTTSATDATKLLVGTLNAYGETAAASGKITDQLFQIQNRGVVTIAEMSQTLGLVTKAAAAGGVSFEELGAAVIVATENNVPFTSSVEGFRGLLSSLESPTEEAQKAMLKYGISVNFATLKQKGLGATLKEIKTAVGEDASALRDIVGSQQAFSLATALTADNLKAFDKEVKGLENSTGAAARSTGILAEGLENRTQAFAAATERLKVSVTRDVLPMATAFVKFATSVTDGISGLPAPIKNLGLLVTGVATGMGVLAGSVLAVRSTMALLGLEAIGITGALAKFGGGISAFLAFDVAKLVPTREGLKALGLAAKTAAVDGVAALNRNFAALFPTLTASTGITGAAALGWGALGLAVFGVTKYFIDLKFAAEAAETQARRAEAGFHGLGKEVTEIRSQDILGNSAKDLVETFGANIDSLRSAALRERAAADNASEETVRKQHLETYRLIKEKEKELNDFIASQDAKQQQAIVTAQQEKEAYKDALNRIEISKVDHETKANQLRALILQYRLVGDERRQIEKMVAHEEEQAHKQALRNEEKRRAESVKSQVQEVENSKATATEKIAGYKRILDTANTNGNERRAIEDKIFAHEKQIQAEREKLAQRQTKIALDASNEKIKIAEHELEQLRKLQEKGVDTTPDQVAQLRIKADEEKKKVDTQLEADLAKEKDPQNQADLRANAKREKTEIEREVQDSITETQERGLQDRLQRQQQTVQQEIEISKRRADQLAKFAGPGQANFLLQQEAARRLQLMLQEIELQRQLTLAQTKDPAQIAQAEALAQQQILDARIQVREEIEATTKAIEDQQKKSRLSSDEFTGNILTLDQFLQGERNRFKTRTAEEFFGSKPKPVNIPGVSDFEIREGILNEAFRDPARRGAGAAGGQSAAPARPVQVDLRGEFRLVNAAGDEVGRLERLSVNGRNSDLNSQTRLLGA